MLLIGTPSSAILELWKALWPRVFLQTFANSGQLPQCDGRGAQSPHTLRFRHSVSPGTQPHNHGLEVSPHIPFKHSTTAFSIILFEGRPTVNSTPRTQVGLQKHLTTKTP
jgi:hypothetical protein